MADSEASPPPPVDPAPGQAGPRLFCPDVAAAGPRALVLDAEQSRHARRVLRLEAPAAVELFDGAGTVAEAVITGYRGDRAECRVERRRVETPAAPELIIGCALPKGPRADDLVDRLGQLGADRLIPLRSTRSVVDPRPTRIERLRRRAIESAKQCRRSTLLRIDETQDLDDVLDLDADVRLLLQAGAAPAAPSLSGARTVLALIGPEGGWTADESAAALARGFTRWTVGPHVLRVETAAGAAVTLLRFLAAL